MKLHRTALQAALGALVLSAAAAPAAAIDDVTGTYEGKVTCRATVAGVTSKTKQDATVEVHELTMDGYLALDVIAGGTPLAESVQGRVVGDATKADRGAIAAVECDLSVVSQVGAMVHADAVIKPGSEKGTLKGTLIDLDALGAVVRICTFSAKRRSTTVPPVPLCVI